MTSDDLSGRQLAEVLKFLSEELQTRLDSAEGIISQLKDIATTLEEKYAR